MLENVRTIILVMTRVNFFPFEFSSVKKNEVTQFLAYENFFWGSEFMSYLKVENPTGCIGKSCYNGNLISSIRTFNQLERMCSCEIQLEILMAVLICGITFFLL